MFLYSIFLTVENHGISSRYSSIYIYIYIGVSILCNTHLFNKEKHFFSYLISHGIRPMIGCGVSPLLRQPFSFRSSPLNLLHWTFSDGSSRSDLLRRIFSNGSSLTYLFRPTRLDLFQQPFSSLAALNPITLTPSRNTLGVTWSLASDRINYIFITSLVYMTYMLQLERKC